MSRPFRHAAVLAVSGALLLGAAGCGGREYGFERESVESSKEKEEARGPATAKPDVGALEAQFQALWPRRDEPHALHDAIALLKKLLDARGGQSYQTLVLLSRAHYILGELEEDKDKKLDAYDAGMRYGDLALHTMPAFREAFEKTKTIEDAVQSVGADGIDAIYWDAVNQSKWANEKGKVKVLFMKDKVKRMIERVLALDETWWYGAAHRYLGSYNAALPTFAGRDLEASKKHFERSIAIAPKYFATRTLMAEYYARNANERRTYQEQLEFVLKTPPEVLPEVAPEQRLEQRKAKRMLAEIDDYFEADEAPPAPAAPPPAEPGSKS